MEQRITVSQASNILGIGEQSIRYYMRIGALPIGRVIKGKGKKNYTYLIYASLVEKFIFADGFQKLAEMESGK